MSRGLSGRRPSPCQRKWVDTPREWTQRYQANTLDCCTTTCHEGRPECLLSSEQAWPSSIRTFTAPEQHRQTSARADKQERRSSTSYFDADDGPNTEQRCCNAQIPTGATYPSTWEESHHQMTRTGPRICRRCEQQYGLPLRQGVWIQNNHRTEQPNLIANPTNITHLVPRRVSTLQPPRIGR